MRVCDVLFQNAEFVSSFYLTGGTALSEFYLQHRESDDLDFFTHEAFPARFESDVSSLLKEFQPETVRRSPSFLRLRLSDSLQVDLAHDSATRFGLPAMIRGVRVDSEENIAVNKVTTILGRLDPKDYVDLMFLVRDHGFDIFDLLKKAKQKDGGLESFLWSQLIADCENFTVLPRMVKTLPLEELKDFYRGLRKKVVRRLKPG